MKNIRDIMSNTIQEYKEQKIYLEANLILTSLLTQISEETISIITNDAQNRINKLINYGVQNPDPKTQTEKALKEYLFYSSKQITYSKYIDLCKESGNTPKIPYHFNNKRAIHSRTYYFIEKDLEIGGSILYASNPATIIRFENSAAIYIKMDKDNKNYTIKDYKFSSVEKV
ncbi:hypothetical protein CL656_02160 [bacterium]|nr:hypothetical protein [bacterium]|tara:strand:+ start:2271 stop:2786 length:516 start_codon:yes stop_codon:yes gene_type:complete